MALAGKTCSTSSLLDIKQPALHLVSQPIFALNDSWAHVDCKTWPPIHPAAVVIKRIVCAVLLRITVVPAATVRLNVPLWITAVFVLYRPAKVPVTGLTSSQIARAVLQIELIFGELPAGEAVLLETG
jgi:hypothetical protein